MAGYVKIWTTIRTNQEYLTLPGNAKGVYLQLLVAVKDQSDNGTILYRNMTALGLDCGYDRRTIDKIVTTLYRACLLTFETGHKGEVVITIPNYREWQELDVKGVRRKRDKNVTKIPPLRLDQTRLDQTRPDHWSVRKKSAPNSEHKLAIEYFVKKHDEFYPGKKYIFKGGKDGKLVKDLLANLKIEEFCELVDQLFLSNDKFYDTGGGRTIGVLSANANKLQQAALARESGLDPAGLAFKRAGDLAGEKLFGKEYKPS
jgi:hypothetical protein